MGGRQCSGALRGPRSGTGTLACSWRLASRSSGERMRLASDRPDTVSLSVRSTAMMAVEETEECCRLAWAALCPAWPGLPLPKVFCESSRSPVTSKEAGLFSSRGFHVDLR